METLPEDGEEMESHFEPFSACAVASPRDVPSLGTSGVRSAKKGSAPLAKARCGLSRPPPAPNAVPLSKRPTGGDRSKHDSPFPRLRPASREGGGSERPERIVAVKVRVAGAADHCQR